MLHLDLFSGIGGFAYAVDQVWPGTEHIFVEYDPFCQQVLKKHWPESLIHGDITTYTPSTGLERSTRQRVQGRSPGLAESPFILTGGFPCQPFSAAGVRRGTSDDRYLWPEMYRIIKLAQPEWVIAENVRGLLTWEQGVVVEQICTDLEAIGYEVQPLIIPAVAINAPHRRDRIWFIARNTKYDGQHGSQDGEGSHQGTNSDEAGPNKDEQPTRPDLPRNDAQNTISQRSGGRSESGGQILERQSAKVQAERPSGENGNDATDTESKRVERGGRSKQTIPESIRHRSGASREWDKNWVEVATELCSVDDGLPAKLDGFELSKSKHRAERLKSLGNAIVPQVAIEIMKGIKYAH